MKNKNFFSLIIIFLVFIFVELFFFLFSFEYTSWQNAIRDSLFSLRYSIKGRESLSPFLYSISIMDSDLLYLNKVKPEYDEYTELLRILRGSHVRGIGIDHVFTGTSHSPDIDTLAHVTMEGNNVYYPVIPYREDDVYNPLLHPDQGIQSKKNLWNPVIVKKGSPILTTQLLAPHRELIRAARGLGHILRSPDSDGIDRRIPLVIKYRDSYLPGFAFRMICDYLQIQQENIHISFGDAILLKNVRFPFSGLRKDIRIPIDEKGRMIINFSGPYTKSFNNYSYETIMKNKDSLGTQLNIDEYGLIFVSSQTIKDYDYNHGIFDNQYPLIYLQLETANTILKEHFIIEYPYYVTFLIRVILILVLWIISIKTSNQLFLFLSVVSGIVYIVFSILVFFYARNLPYILNPCLSLFLSVITLFIYRILSRIAILREEQEKQKEMLLQANKLVTLGTMVSGIAHDVNNPNNVITLESGFIAKNFSYFKEVLDKISDKEGSLLLKEISYPELKEDFIQSIAGIQRASQKIGEIVGELKNFYKKASPDRTEPVDLVTVINSSLFLLSHELNKTAIVHFSSPPDELPHISGNSQRLEQVFINIIQNSCIAIRERNKIEGNHEKRDISIIVYYDNVKKNIRICIEDQGCGIDNKIIDRITEPFFSTRLHDGGSGLGLFIVKTIINTHNGNIEFCSRQGKGMKVIISFPVLQ